jgi:hypothetical protein
MSLTNKRSERGPNGISTMLIEYLGVGRARGGVKSKGIIA